MFIQLQKFLIIPLIFLISSYAYAATESQLNVKIINMTSHNDEAGGTGVTYLYLSNNISVYIPKVDKMNTTLALTSFAAAKTVTIWNYTAATEAPKSFWNGPGVGSGGTVQSMRVHRIDVSAN